MIPQEHMGQPEPDEPWRYVCPNCNRQVHKSDSSTKFRCNPCKESFDFNELKDKTKDKDIEQKGTAWFSPTGSHVHMHSKCRYVDTDDMRETEIFHAMQRIKCSSSWSWCGFCSGHME